MAELNILEAIRQAREEEMARDEELRADVKAEVNEASKRAEARPDPVADDAHERVYANPIPGSGTPTPLAPIGGEEH